MDIEILTAFSDNYVYLAHDGQAAAVVDPSEAGSVIEAVRRLAVTPGTILVTHGHMDHTAGVEALTREYGCDVIGPGFAEGAGAVSVGGVQFEVLPVPGHTPTHVAYYSADAEVLFAGDTLFTAGCGRIQAGRAADMWDSLATLRALPEETRVYGGHDYTVENLEFAASLEPRNQAVAERLAWARDCVRRGVPTVPSTIGVERETNPFLRSDSEAMQAAAGKPGASPVRVFAELRRRKDAW